MTELLDDSANEEWAEAVLEKTKVGRLRVFLEVSASTSGATSWSTQRHGFIISLPKKQVHQPAELFPVFRGKLLTSFDVEKKPQVLTSRPGGAGSGTADEWADVEVNAATGKPDVVEKQENTLVSSRRVVEFLPTAVSLPRPDELFLKPPYHLRLIPGSSEIEIQCSHSPSLQLIADYMERWCRVNHNDTTEVCCASMLAFGPFYADNHGISHLECRFTSGSRRLVWARCLMHSS